MNKSLANLGHRQKFALAKQQLRRRISPAINRMQRGAFHKKVGLAYRIFGSKAGARAFWNSSKQHLTPMEVLKRTAWLADHKPSALRGFVQAGLEAQNSYLLIQSFLDREETHSFVQDYFPCFTGKIPSEFEERVRKSPRFAASYVICQAKLYGYEIARAADRHVRHQMLLPRDAYEQSLESLSIWASNPSPKEIQTPGLETKAKHRLVIVENFKQPQGLVSLVQNADEVTLLDISDLYGKTDLNALQCETDAELHLEHVRTRITRFSKKYHDLHAETRALAETILEQINQTSHDHELFGDTKKLCDLDLADVLFFEMLKVRAIATLVADETFDHIVINLTSDDLNRRAIKLLSKVSSLNDDTRVEFTSTAPFERSRFALKKNVEAILYPRTSSPHGDDISLYAAEIVFRDLDKKAERYAEKLTEICSNAKKDPAKPDIFFFVGHSGAHNAASVAYLNALKSGYNVTPVLYGGALKHVLRSSSDAGAVFDNTNPISISFRAMPGMRDLENFLVDFVYHADLSNFPIDIVETVKGFAQHLVKNSILPSLIIKTVMRHWYAQLSEAQELPKLVLLCPQRNAKLGIACEQAREFGVPSLSLEPHVINGNYCRYTKVATDYYAVISEHFRESSALQFGISKERTRVIGSPRIIAPVIEDAEQHLNNARDELQNSNDLIFEKDKKYLTFFCQPTDWTHVEKVWRNTVSAINPDRDVILLKTHPEESVARVAKYKNIAAELGRTDNVFVIDGKPDTVIAASELLLTGYSTGALDAAIQKKPVISVTAEHKEYPVDQHEIIGSPFCGDEEELRREINLVFGPEAKNTSLDFLEREVQFKEGPDERLLKLTSDIIQQGAAAIRPVSERPKAVFLDGPFTEFNL